MLPPNPTGKQIEQHVQDALDQREYDNQYQPSPIANHNHDGVNSPPVGFQTLSPGALAGTYLSKEYNNGSVTGTATINWANGNVQYVTLTGNTTFTFTNPQAGIRCNLFVAGAHTPTWPSSVRWPSSTTPTATATSGHGDEYGFIYRGLEKLYHGFFSANYATT